MKLVFEGRYQVKKGFQMVSNREGKAKPRISSVGGSIYNVWIFSGTI